MKMFGWANFRALIEIFSKNVGPSIAIWASPVQFSFHRAIILLGALPALGERVAARGRRRQGYVHLPKCRPMAGKGWLDAPLQPYHKHPRRPAGGVS